MKRDPRNVVMTVSLLMSVVMVTGKLTAFALTRSAAIFSDAAESIVHGVATGFAAFSLWYARRPADVNHPYGHGRIAYFSAGFEGALVLTASVAVIYQGVKMLIQGSAPDNLALGMGIAGGLAVINLVLGGALIRIGKAHNELILVANGKHVLSDMWTTAAAIIGVGLVMLTGINWFDPLVAICIGGYIMVTGIKMIRESFGGLMDEIDPEVSSRLVEGLRGAVDDGLIHDFHQLRCRKVNDEIWVDVHFLMPGELSTNKAHERASKVEEALRSLFPKSRFRITSHVEPSDHEAAHPEGHPGPADPLTDQQPTSGS